LGNDFSVAWRTLDAQFWGVPQRRRRIYLVADFDGECAGKVLFEYESVSGYSPQGFETWQDLITVVESGIGETGKCFVVENHAADSRVRIDESGVVQTLTSAMGTGGGNVPLVMKTAVIQNAIIGRDNNKSNGFGVSEDICFTPDTAGPHAVCSTSKNSFHTIMTEEVVSTLVASDYKDPPTVIDGFVIRRLTPTECARLQGFPDWWCEDVEKRSDSAEYKMWGNGVALPCVRFILAGIVWADKQADQTFKMKPSKKSLF
jgi:Site-specific DNA methylase